VRVLRRPDVWVAITPAIRVASPERTPLGAENSQRGAYPTRHSRTPTAWGVGMKTDIRPKVDDRLVMAVAHRLTERDRSILTMLFRHRVFTTDQLAEMYFDNLNTAQHRLITLYQLRLVDRFQPIDRRFVSQPYHYVLDQLGAMVMAAAHDEDPAKLHWQQDKASPSDEASA